MIAAGVGPPLSAAETWQVIKIAKLLADTLREPLWGENKVSKLRTMLGARRPIRAKSGESYCVRRPLGPASTPGPGASSRIPQRVRGPLHPPTALIVVGISDLAAISKTGQLVTYALGSCVGVVGYDERNCVAGLLHVLLPESKAALRPATYADTGIPALMCAMQRLGANPQTSSFRLAGGASMLKSSATLQVGRRNVLAVRNAFRTAGLRLQGEAIGGTQPRTMCVDSKTGLVTITSPGRQEVQL